MREMLARDTMTEIEFNQAANATLAHIEQALEAADLDFETPADGIIEVEFDDGSKIIINRHGVAREIWVAARSGGFHFKPQDGGWVDTKDGTPLYDRLTALIAAQGGAATRF
ncbi:MAG: iron donor protein CyaY [Thiobacillus sp.]|nr:iron donor protein CyaY [Thiobacillus sp.]